MKRTIHRNPPLCACGCGLPVRWNRQSKNWNTWINRHSGIGRITSLLHRKHLSESHKGKVPWNKGKTGCQTAWNKGKKGEYHFSDIGKENISIGRKRYCLTHHGPTFGKTFSKEVCIKRGKAIHAAYLRRPEPVHRPPTSLITRKKISKALRGPNNYLWQGGLYRPYPKEWTRWLKDDVKQRDNYQCQNPSCKHKNNTLCIHHIDHNKNNCSLNNLITLCVSCHVATNNNREYWIQFYREKMEAPTGSSM